MGRVESPLICAHGINNTGSLGMLPAIEDMSAIELESEPNPDDVGCLEISVASG